MESPIPSVPFEAKFGKFLLRQRLGAGAMAEVFLAESVGPDGFRRLVAIKRILPCYSRDEDFILRFKSEALLGGSLNHNNIVPAFDFGREGEHYFIVMAFVDGLALNKLLRYQKLQQEPFPLSVVLDIIKQLCDGLAYAHSARDPMGRPLNMIHRDLKPANILVSQFGEIKITDFGIAKASTNLQQTAVEPDGRGTAVGTIAYMSPEQARAETLDHRSDLYSLGAIFFELLTLQPLYPNAQGIPGLYLVQQGNAHKRFHLLEPFPAEVGRIVVRLLARELDNRYESATAVKRDIQALSTLVPQSHLELSDIVRRALEGVGGRPAGDSAMPLLPAEHSQGSLPMLDQSLEPGINARIQDPAKKSDDPAPERLQSPERTTLLGPSISKASWEPARALRWGGGVVGIGLLVLFAWSAGRGSLGSSPIAPEVTHRPVAAQPPAQESAVAGPPVVTPLVGTVDTPGANVDSGTEATRAPLVTSKPTTVPTVLPVSKGNPARPRSPGPTPFPTPAANGSTVGTSASSALTSTVKSFGSLSVNSKPFSVVYVNGRKLGETPIRDESLQAGHHTVELKTEDGITRKVVEVDIRSGELTNLRTIQLGTE